MKGGLHRVREPLLNNDSIKEMQINLQMLQSPKQPHSPFDQSAISKFYYFVVKEIVDNSQITKATEGTALSG